MSEEQRYSYRITLNSVMLNDEDKQFTAEFDEYLLNATRNEADSIIKAQEIVEYEAITSGEKIVISYTSALLYSTLGYGPYEDYVSADSQ